MLANSVRAPTLEGLVVTHAVMVEAAWRIRKCHLSFRPIWRQRPESVQAHILVCFLAYVLWKTLSGPCRAAGLGEGPRRILEESLKIKLVDVVLPSATLKPRRSKAL